MFRPKRIRAFILKETIKRATDFLISRLCHFVRCCALDKEDVGKDFLDGTVWEGNRVAARVLVSHGGAEGSKDTQSVKSEQ